MTSLAKSIEPKSDQINADDLIGKSMTIKVSRVTGIEGDAQPISIHFEGDNGKPYKPCKSMRRVLVMTWGDKGNEYVGRSMTLYRDEKVMFGGIAVGGIRISHLSHIDKEVTMALTASRASRKPYTVKPLIGSEPSAVTEEAKAFAQEIEIADIPEKFWLLEARYKEIVLKLEAARLPKWKASLTALWERQKTKLHPSNILNAG